MNSSYLPRLIVAILVLSQMGCGKTDISFSKKPSYADLVVTYNAEIETLEKLEAKRKSLIADYYGQAQQKAIRAAVTSIESGEAHKLPSNPNQALDSAVAAAELQAQLQSGLVQSLGMSDSADDPENLPEELQRTLAEIDSEITAQQQRVQRAKEARDAAQPK